MPELPEVETVCRGIEPHITGQTVQTVIVRQTQLRWPIPATLMRTLKNQTVRAVKRRAKYLLIEFNNGSLIIHLGMSGRLYICQTSQAIHKHDHVDIIFSQGLCLRLRDPRRFGCMLWAKIPEQHALLKQLGPEPLTKNFTGEILFQRAQKRKTPIKSFLMDNRNVVGVGNIYAAEALFLAGIHPLRPAGEITKNDYDKLVHAIKKVLNAAIKKGGTTLRDFVNGDSKPGYFSQKLQVYGRERLACFSCQSQLQLTRINQRSTVFCPRCQT